MSKQVKYDIVIIKHSKADKFFVAKLPSFNKARGSGLLMNYLNFRSSKTNECPYKKLTEYYNSQEDKNYIVRRVPKSCDREEAEQIVYNQQEALIQKYGDCILNDIVINPSKYMCECGNYVRYQFKQEHDEEYCGAKKIDFLEPNDLNFNLA